MLRNKKLLFFPALALGILVLVVAIRSKPTPPLKPSLDNAKAVNVLSLQRQAIAPLAVGFGKVAPKLQWQALAEVSGKVVYRHPQLAKGQILLAGTEVLRIDPRDYQLKRTQAEAELEASLSELDKIAQQEKNLKASIAIEAKRLELANKELKRAQDLRKRGLIAQSEADQTLLQTLSQQKQLLDLESQLALIPSSLSLAKAQLSLSEAKLEEAQRLLAKTIITLPFDLRISDVNIEQGQVVNQQQSMLLGHGIEVMEIEAQFSLHDIQTIAASLDDFRRDDSGIPRAELNRLNAHIELSSGAFQARWPAKLARISETVDPNQATVGVIFEVKQNYRELSPLSAPPLVNGMFVQAFLEGQQQAHWAIPEYSLHGERIYLLNDEEKLSITPVSVLYRRDNAVVIKGELPETPQLITSDLLPAINGMQLRIVSDSTQALESAP